MVWVQLILAVIQLIVKLPGIIEKLKEIFGLFEGLHPVAATAEARRLLPAIRAKLAQVEGQSFDAACPIAAYCDDFHKRRSAESRR